MGHWLLFAALALGVASAPPAEARQLQDSTPGTCIETHAIAGYGFEDNQDQTSLQVSATVADIT